MIHCNVTSGGLNERRWCKSRNAVLSYCVTYRSEWHINPPSPVLLSRERAREPSSQGVVGLLRSPIVVLCHHHFCAFGMPLRDGAAKMMPLFPSWVQSTIMQYWLLRCLTGILMGPVVADRTTCCVCYRMALLFPLQYKVKR